MTRGVRSTALSTGFCAGSSSDAQILRCARCALLAFFASSPSTIRSSQTTQPAMSAHVPEPNALGIPSEHQAQYDECIKIAKALEGIRRARANSGKVIDAVSDIEGFLKLNWTQITLQSLSDISGQIQSTIADLRRGVRNSTAEILESLVSWASSLSSPPELAHTINLAGSILAAVKHKALRLDSRRSRSEPFAHPLASQHARSSSAQGLSNADKERGLQDDARRYKTSPRPVRSVARPACSPANGDCRESR